MLHSLDVCDKLVSFSWHIFIPSLLVQSLYFYLIAISAWITFHEKTNSSLGHSFLSPVVKPDILNFKNCKLYSVGSCEISIQIVTLAGSCNTYSNFLSSAPSIRVQHAPWNILCHVKIPCLPFRNSDADKFLWCAGFFSFLSPPPHYRKN